MQRDYYPFGQTLNAAGDDLTSMQFSQKQVAPDSNIYYFGVRYYSPRIGRWLVPDPAGQCWSPYSYAFNNPLIYVDPDGEFILIAMAVGGAINLGIKAYQGKIHSGWDAVAAFGIGAAAGGVGAITGGAAFVAFGGAAGGAGGFIAGAMGGMTGTAFASPIQAIGNSAFFGDPMMTPKQWATGVAIGGLTGGLMNGGIAAYNGRSFWSGKLPSTQSVPVLNNTVFEAKLNTSRRMPSLESPRAEVLEAIPDEGAVNYHSSYYKKVSGIDGQHVWNRETINIVADNGKIFPITGGDGQPATLIQILGKHHGTNGVFEIIVRGGEVVHQRFIPGGFITGSPNQIVNNVSGSVSPAFPWWNTKR
jgi:RHS repeat-associated protein